MRRVLMDYATLRDAHSVLYDGSRYGSFHPHEIAIVSLSQLIESIVLFDEIIIPGVPHIFGEKLAKNFDEGVSYRPIDHEQYYLIERTATEWTKKLDVDEALEAANLGFTEMPRGSDGYALSAIFLDHRAPLLGFLPEIREVSRYFEQGSADRIEPAIASETRELIAQISTENAERSEAQGNVPSIYHKHYRMLSSKADVYPVRLVRNTAFIAYWLLNRSRSYDLLSRSMGINYLPHPTRATATYLSSAADGRASDPSRIALGPYLDALENSYRRGHEQVTAAGINLLPLRYAPVFQYVLSKCRAKRDILAAAYETRHSKGATALRRRLEELDALALDGNLKDALRLAKEVGRASRIFDTELGLRLEGGSVSVSIHGISAKVPIPIAQLGKALSLATNSRLLFLRNIFQELSASSRLGEYHEMLLRRDGRHDSDDIDGPTREELRRHAAAFLSLHNDTRVTPNKAAFDAIRSLSPEITSIDVKKIIDEAWDLIGEAQQAQSTETAQEPPTDE